jgi:hypothetical protein
MYYIIDRDIRPVIIYMSYLYRGTYIGRDVILSLSLVLMGCADILFFCLLCMSVCMLCVL